MKINENFLKIEASYLFSTVAKKQREYQAAHPEADVIRLSIGDVTKPLAPVVIEAMHKAVDEMASEDTFRGYPPEYGYDFILEAIQKHDYTDRGIDIAKDEIFLSDGVTLFILYMLIQILWQAEAVRKTRTACGQISFICLVQQRIISHLISLRKFRM